MKVFNAELDIIALAFAIFLKQKRTVRHLKRFALLLVVGGFRGLLQVRWWIT